jgi:hypothetical protein
MGDVIIIKGQGGLGRLEPSKDGISGIVVMGTAEAGGAQLDTVYKLRSVEELEDLLITEARDATEKELIWHHVNDFFRMNPNGELYLVIKDKTGTFVDAIDTGVPALLSDSNGDIKLVGCIWNGAAVPADDTIFLAAVQKAQEKCTEAATANRPISILLQAVKADTTSDAHTLNAPDVHAVAGQNLYLVNLDPLFAVSTVTGLALGLASRLAVNENLGWVGPNNVFGGNLAVAALNGSTIIGNESDLIEADENGFITLKTYVDKEGIYFNDAYSCTVITSDYAYLENNRTVNKAIRNVRKALLPFVNSPVRIDPNTGKLEPQVMELYKMTARRSVDEMVNNDEVSGINIVVDPNQNILATSELMVEVEITPTGTARTIKVKIGFTNPFNA